jgi:hypothetical protein
MLEGRGQGSQDVSDERVVERARTGGKLVRDVLRLCEVGCRGTPVWGRGVGALWISLGMFVMVEEVSSDSCFDACGDVTMVMAGWFGDEALTDQAGPSGCFDVRASSFVSASSTTFLLPLPPLMTLFKLPYADWPRSLLLPAVLPLASPANLSLELLASGTAVSVFSAVDHAGLIRGTRPLPTKEPMPAAHPGPVLVISPCGGRCASYSSARLILLLAHISAMASMASRISGSTARRIAEKENSSIEGSRSLLPARPADRAEGLCLPWPFMFV